MMYKNLKTIRHDAGLKQTDISSRLSVSVPTVYKWEKGRAPVARKHWSELAELLRVSVDELEEALVQTLLDSCRERGNTEALKNAASSGLYRPELLQDAFARLNVYAPTIPPVPVPSSTASSLTEKERLDYEREIVRLREENVKLREELLKLRERLSPSPRPSTSLESTLHTITEESEVKK